MNNKRFVQGRQWCIPQAGGIVLEIGFGAGSNLPYYNFEKITKLIALEPNKELINLSDVQTKLDVELIEGYAENIPLEDSCVDCVVFTWTLCSVDNVKDVLRDIYRVLKPGGKVVFIEHGRSTSPILSKLQSLVTPIWSKCSGGCRLDRSYFDTFEEVGFSFKNKEQVGTEYRGVAGKKQDELRVLLADVNVIFINGGNTFYLLKHLKESGMSELILELLEKGVVYVGASAGSYVACPSIIPATLTRDVDRYGLDDLGAMNLVPFLVKAHYADNKKAEIQLGAERSGLQTLALTDEQALVVEDDEITPVSDMPIIEFNEIK